MKNYANIEEELKKLKEEDLLNKSLLSIYKEMIESLHTMTESVSKNFNAAAILSLLENNLTDLIKVSEYSLVIKAKGWQSMLSSTEDYDFDAIDFTSALQKVTKVQSAKLLENDALSYFDYVIPVLHNNEHLAFLFLKDIRVMTIGISKQEKLNFLETLLNLTIISLENKKIFKHSKAEVTNEDLILAAEVQSELIPNVFPQNKHFQFFGKYIPFDIIGGDYYDFIELDEDNIAFCICDVAGKGVSAGMLMSNFQASLRTLLSRDYELKELVVAINKKFIAVTKQNRYISMFIAKYNLKTRKLEFVNAGHNPPVLFNKNKTSLLNTGCTVLGMISDLPHLESEEIILENGAFLLMYTDGLSEIENEKEEEFDVEMLSQFVTEHHQFGVKIFTEQLIKKVEKFKGENEIFDDVSILVAKFFNS